MYWCSPPPTDHAHLKLLAPPGYYCSHFITFLLFAPPSLYYESSFSYYGGMMWFMVSTVGVIINRWAESCSQKNPLREYLQSWFSAFPPLPNFLPLSRHPLALAAPLSLMMGVFLFCGGCELSEFVFVSLIPSASAPAYKSGRGPSASSHDISLFCDNSVTNPAAKVRAKKIYDSGLFFLRDGGRGAPNL